MFDLNQTPSDVKQPTKAECCTSLALMALFVALSWGSIYLIVTDLVASASLQQPTTITYTMHH